MYVIYQWYDLTHETNKQRLLLTKAHPLDLACQTVAPPQNRDTVLKKLFLCVEGYM